MKKTIWKFELLPISNQTIEMPEGAEILTVQSQYENPCIWALVDTNSFEESRTFEIFGTGEEVHCDMGIDRNYLGTYQLNDGDLVYHVFERIN